MIESTCEWWETMFDTDWIKMFAYKNRDARKEAGAIRKLLGIPRGRKILDVACGDGRISLALARLGFQVTGLDASECLLQHAEAKALKARININWMRGDMREIGMTNQFDAAINIFTSFGYFNQEDENLKALKSINQSLKRNGKFILDIENIFFIARAAQISGSERMYRPVDNYRGWVEEITDFNPAEQRVEMSLRLWVRGEKTIKTGKASYRAFTLIEMRRLLKEAGFHLHSVFGDFNLSDYTVNSERMIMLCIAEK